MSFKRFLKRWLISISAIFFCLHPLFAQVNSEKHISIPIFKQLYIAFAGPFPASPSSAFGHVFLVIEPDSSGKTPYLLWKAINFGANVESINQMQLFYHGLFGGLNGKFSELYFHEKIQEYTNIESRPIWLVPISLSEKEKLQFNKEVNKREKEKYPYRFTDLNCVSYIEDLILSSLDSTSVMPSRFYTTPYDLFITSKKITPRLGEPILLKSVEQILSDTSSKNEQNHSFQLLFMEKKLQLDNRLPTKLQQEVLGKLRMAVSEQQGSSIDKVVYQDKKLFLHPFQFIETFGGVRDKKPEFLLNYRLAAHDFHDKDDTFSPVELFELAKISTGITLNQKPLIYQYSLFSQMSLQTSTPLRDYYAWVLSIGGKRRVELSGNPFSHEIEIGSGKSFYWFGNRDFTSAFLISTVPSYRQTIGFRFEIKAQIIQLINYKSITWSQNLEQYVDVFNKGRIEFNPVYSSTISFKLAASFRLLQTSSLSKNGLGVHFGFRKNF